MTDSGNDAQARARFRPVSARNVPRFGGVATFLRLPLHDDPQGLDVMLCGVPFDGGTTFRPGARFGPRAVRAASALSRGFYPVQDVEIFEHLACADGGDVFCVPMDTARTLDSIAERVRSIAAAQALPVLVGGDHTISLGALRALAEQHGPLGLVHFDAHSDTFGPAWGVELHHGTVFRKAIEEGLLRPQDVLQIGIRGPFTQAHDLAFARQHGITIATVEDAKEQRSVVASQIRTFSARGPCYVSFDMDCLDPAFAPGTGTPVPGGLSSYEAFQLLRALDGKHIVGADVVEISPDHDPSGNTALVAVTVLGEMLAVVAAARRA